MKKVFLFIIPLWCAIVTIAAQVKSSVQESFELTSIAFRLADANEYVNNDIPNYAAEIDQYFAGLKNHGLISYIKEIREKQGIGFDAVPLAAGCIEVKEGKVVAPQCNAAKIDEIDKRWTEQSFKKFVSLLNDFYKKSRFGNFYTQHTELYNLAENRMDEVLLNLNIGWFKSQFGNALQDPLVVVSLCNGGSNYAFSRTGEGKRIGVVIGSNSDQEGKPAYDEQVIFIIVHELLHHYVNLRIQQCWDQIDSASQTIYSQVKDKMAKLAYGEAQTMITEWLVNLLSIMYINDNPGTGLAADHLIARAQINGFIWMERSMKFMEYYRTHRSLYTTIDDFMPQITGFINFTAANIDHILTEYENRQPYVVDAYPVPGSTIPAEIDTISIRFSEPMFMAHGLKLIDDKSIKPLAFTKMPFWKDVYTYCIILDKSKLAKGETYGCLLDRMPFQSDKTYPMKEDYPYTFKMPD